MRRKLATIAISCIFLTVLAASCFAGTVRGTYVGTVTSGADAANIFGGNVTAGDRVTGTFQYEVTGDVSGGTYIDTGGGTTWLIDRLPPLVAFTQTVNGITHIFGDSNSAVSYSYGSVEGATDSAGFSNTGYLPDYHQYTEVHISAAAGLLLPSAKLLQTFSIIAPPVSFAQSYFINGSEGNYTGSATDFSFSIDELSVEITEAPEPSTSLCVAVGLGLSTLTCRRSARRGR